MKTKKMIGAFALTLALAMGTAPAFAASVGSDKVFSDNGNDTAGGDTVVKAELINDQLNCTVPLEVTVVMGSKGYSEIQCPSSDAYGITNNSTTANVNLVGIDCSDAAFDMRSNILPEDMHDDGESGICLTIQAGSTKTWLSTSHGLGQMTSTDKNVVNKDGQNMGYVSGKEFKSIEIPADTTLPITLAGEAYFDQKVDASDLTDSTLCKIVYTVQVA